MARVLAVFALVLVLLTGMGVVSPATAQNSCDPLSSIEDTDSDNLPNAWDPDVDGDGISDADDPDPCDPSVPGSAPVTPPYNPIASDQDSDGDNIPNNLDPADNTQGIPDQVVVATGPTAVPAAPPPPVGSSNTGVTTPSTTGNASADVQPASSQSQVNGRSAPLVTSLPKTGVGSGETSLISILPAALVLVGGAALYRRRNVQ